MVNVRFCYLNDEIFEGPYHFHSTSDRDGRREEKYVERTHLYIREQTLYEDEVSGVSFIYVWADMEAYFVLNLCHPREIQAVWVGWTYHYHRPPMYVQEAEQPLLSAELRTMDWDILMHSNWMSQIPLSQLTDVAIINKLAHVRFRRDQMTPSAWLNLAR